MEGLRRRTKNEWDDAITFINEKTTLAQLQDYLKEHHPHLQIGGDNLGNWQGHAIQRAACAQNSQLIRDIIQIAGTHLLEPINDMNPINVCMFSVNNEALLNTVETLIELGAKVNCVSRRYGSPLYMVTQNIAFYKDEDEIDSENADMSHEIQSMVKLENLLRSHGALSVPPIKKMNNLE